MTTMNTDERKDYEPIHTPIYKQADLDRAATRMRDLCVEKIREVLRPYELEFRRKTNSATNIVDYAVMALESLTLDQVKEKQS